MPNTLIYVNHLNQRVTLGNTEVLLDQHQARDYQWQYDSLYNKIVNFRKDITTLQIPVTIVSDDKNDIANLMFEIFEKDVLSKTPGKLYCGDSYIYGYIVGQSNTDFVYNKVIKITLTFVTDKPLWLNEHPFLFRINNSAATEEGLGYPFDYPYDFLSPISIQSFNNTSFTDSDFIMKVYGPIDDPGISIGGNKYKVDCSVGSNEYLTINSKEKTIIRTTQNGQKVNEFANRDNSEGYIFQKIAPGTQMVAMDTQCNLDITILEERSEPIWS